MTIFGYEITIKKTEKVVKEDIYARDMLKKLTYHAEKRLEERFMAKSHTAKKEFMRKLRAVDLQNVFEDTPSVAYFVSGEITFVVCKRTGKIVTIKPTSATHPRGLSKIEEKEVLKIRNKIK